MVDGRQSSCGLTPLLHFDTRMHSVFQSKIWCIFFKNQQLFTTKLVIVTSGVNRSLHSRKYSSNFESLETAADGQYESPVLAALGSFRDCVWRCAAIWPFISILCVNFMFQSDIRLLTANISLISLNSNQALLTRLKKWLTNYFLLISEIA